MSGHKAAGIDPHPTDDGSLHMLVTYAVEGLAGIGLGIRCICFNIQHFAHENGFRSN